MMSSQSIRFFLFAALVLVGSLLYNKWQEEHQASTQPAVVTTTTSQQLTEDSNPTSANLDSEIPNANQITHAESNLENKKSPAELNVPSKHLIKVTTDVLNLSIDTVGGDIVQLSLPKYQNVRESVHEDYYLLDHSEQRYYIAQSGLASEQGPDVRGKGRATYVSSLSAYHLAATEDKLIVDLNTKTEKNVEVTKRFTFHKGSYTIAVEYIIVNKGIEPYRGSFYARLKRKPEVNKSTGFLGMDAQTYSGAAIDTPETPYKKLPFKDIEEKPFEQTFMGGWIAMVEHYFVSAWVPKPDATSTFRAFSENGIAQIGFVENTLTVLPNESKTISADLYAGPQVTEVLAKVAPGLELTVDYGILWPICQPIFWVLKQLYNLTGNWGVAIILITLLIKGLFYKLSATSYRSMARMRKLQPKIEALKERYGDDKQKFSQSVMELYKKEKVNPLGGCLPVIVQIPVFIALYYVLLGSVELRLSPFMLWITDLSEKDPYYVLPVLMGLSMLVQQRLNPQPADPMQAKMMMLMPIVFTVLFLNFPSGLVLYWLISNLLSIAQQWLITRNIESSGKHHGVKPERI